MSKSLVVVMAAFGFALTSLCAPSQAKAKWTPPVTKSPTGKPKPKSSDALESVRQTFTACEKSMKAHPNAANAEEADQQVYMVWRAWMDKLEPGLSTYDASIDYTSDRTPSKFLPKCDKYFNDYANGVGAADLPLSTNCEARVKPFLKGTATALDEYRANPKTKQVTYVRSKLSYAHMGMFTKYEGMFGRCATNDKFKKAFAPLKTEYDRLDAAIVQLESANNAKYIPPAETLPSPMIGAAVSGGSTGGILYAYIDLRTGEKLTNPRF